MRLREGTVPAPTKRPSMSTQFDHKLSEVIDRERRRGDFDEEDIRRVYGQLVDRLRNAIQRARSDASPGAYGVLEILLDATRGDLRESVQALTHERMWNIVRRLRDGEAIDDEDRQLIRLWLVGDADAYAFEEQDLEAWLVQPDRLGSEVATLAEADPERGVSLNPDQ